MRNHTLSAINAGLVLASLILALAVSEALLRAFRSDLHAVWPPGLVRVLHPDPEILPGVSGPSRVTASADGLRGDREPRGEALRIIAIGGSTTESLYLDDSETWPRLLQEALAARGGSQRPVWVGNAGRSGLNSRHHILQVRFLADQFPRTDAFLILAGANDLLMRLGLDAGYQPFTGVDALPPEDHHALMSRAFASWPDPGTGEAFWRRTEIWRRLRAVRHRLLRPPAPELLDERGEVYRRWRRNRAASTSLRAVLPDLSTALEEYRANLHTMVDDAGRRGIPVYLVTQPALWHPSLPERERGLLWMGGVGPFQGEPGQPYYTPEALAKGLARYNDVMGEVCATTPATCLDLAGQLPRDLSVFYDDMHFNESGARQVAELLAQLLASRLASGPDESTASGGPD